MNEPFDLGDFLTEKAHYYNRPSFIPNDPVSIPHGFTKRQDIEIAGLFAAILAWGQRKTIINKCLLLMDLMGNEPHHFVLSASENDLQGLEGFKHRTFNDTDLLYFIHFLRHVYKSHDSLESIFIGDGYDHQPNIEQALINFYEAFIGLPEFPNRTKKHVQNPLRNSACKRINMYLRWMVRKDDKGVDFGLWRHIHPRQLICPCDLHVDRVARRLGLIQRKQTDWKTALELTDRLRAFNPEDPVLYDFALFGLGIEEKLAPIP